VADIQLPLSVEERDRIGGNDDLTEVLLELLGGDAAVGLLGERVEQLDGLLVEGAVRGGGDNDQCLASALNHLAVQLVLRLLALAKVLPEGLLDAAPGAHAALSDVDDEALAAPEEDANVRANDAGLAERVALAEALSNVGLEVIFGDKYLAGVAPHLPVLAGLARLGAGAGHVDHLLEAVLDDRVCGGSVDAANARAASKVAVRSGSR
jgi:hypothetical protein